MSGIADQADVTRPFCPWRLSARQHSTSSIAYCSFPDGRRAIRELPWRALTAWPGQMMLSADYYGIDGLLRTRDVFGWSLERSNEWLLAHASAAVLRPTAESLSSN